MFDYVAIDFETATHYMGSACSIGIAAVEGAEIVDTFYSLIRPTGNSFDNDNIAIHNITPEMTEAAPTFAELWPQINKYFDEHTPVIAHNAHFDMSVLRLSADFELPDFVYMDSMHIAAYFIGDHMSLDDCAKAASIDCSAHHNALNDAQVCASLVSCFLTDANCMTLWEFAAKYPACADIKLFSDLKPLKYLGGRKKSYPQSDQQTSSATSIQLTSPTRFSVKQLFLPDSCPWKGLKPCSLQSTAAPSLNPLCLAKRTISLSAFRTRLLWAMTE